MILLSKNLFSVNYFVLALGVLIASGCNQSDPKLTTNPDMVHLVTLDPGHFHAALVQKSMYPDVDSVVYVYAPEGNDLQYHLDRINSYNTRADSATDWKEIVYTGNDFFEKMIAEKKGNVVVLSGNNQKKAEYILKSLQNGFNVLADKPMVIESKDFSVLQQAFETAKEKNLLLYDIMTERYEITTMLQKELSMLPDVFGSLEKGTADNPAVTKESVHHFYKYVSGSVLTRPAWFMDVSQQGEGLVDVTTHLVDLVQWECFPEQIIDYTKDIQLTKAKRWPTEMRLSEFRAITKMDSIPAYLKKDVVNDSILKIYSNGEINYTLKGVHAKVSVTWRYKAPEGAGDTHYSIMRGTKANLIIRQGAEQQYKPTLYIEPVSTDAAYENVVADQIKNLQQKYPGIELKKLDKGWELTIPEKYKEGHESHFASVTEKFLEYLKNKNMPEWEVPNILSKYYTTTKALELAKKN
jgi:predicted dehydrogenase